MFGVCLIVTRPAGWLVDVVTGLSQLGSCGSVGSDCGVQPGGGTAAIGAPSVLNSTPAEPVVSLRTHGVVDQPHPQRVLHRDAAAVPSRDVVRDDVVGDGDVIPGGRSAGERRDVLPLTICRRRPPPLPLSALLPMIRLRVDQQVATGPFGQPGRAVGVGCRIAALETVGERTVGRGAQHRNAATVRRDGRALALVEQDPVVLDRAVVAEAGVRDAAGVARAQVAAHPVVVDRVAIRARVSVMPPAAEGVPEYSASPIDALPVTMLWCTFTLRLKPYPTCRPATRLSASVTGSPGGGGLVASPTMNGSGNSPLPIVMPPVSVPWLATFAGVGHLQVVVPAVRPDRAATLRAVDDADAIDARRVAQEVAGAVVASVGLRGARRAVGVAVGEVRIPAGNAAGGRWHPRSRCCSPGCECRGRAR